MKVLFVASEASPFIKTGGLGDVMCITTSFKKTWFRCESSVTKV